MLKERRRGGNPFQKSGPAAATSCPWISRDSKKESDFKPPAAQDEVKSPKNPLPKNARKSPRRTQKPETKITVKGPKAKPKRTRKRAFKNPAIELIAEHKLTPGASPELKGKINEGPRKEAPELESADRG